MVPTGSNDEQHGIGTTRVKRGMAEMLKGGVIMDVVTPEQAKIAEDAGEQPALREEDQGARADAEGADEGDGVGAHAHPEQEVA